MDIYPDFYLKSVLEITPEFCNKNNIKGLILDIDNTLIDIDRTMLEGAIEWHKKIVNAGIKTIILSNSHKIDKVSKVAEDLGIEYINFAKKPSRKGFWKAKEILGLKENEIAAVGDQIFTDVIGAKRSNMKSILVIPVDPNRDFWYTKWKRPIENALIQRYLKKVERNGI